MEGDMSEVVSLTMHGSTALVTIERERALNAINAAVLEGLSLAVEQCRASDEIRVVVLAGSGDKAFVAGADIASMESLTPPQAESFARRGQEVLSALESLSQPTLAAVGGFALGGGCELAMACDLILVGERARFGQPEVKLGVIPGFGGTQRLVRRVGRTAALDLCLTGRMIGAEEALRMGLASRRVEGDVVEAALAIADEIAGYGPVALAYAKRAIHDHADGSMESGLAAERALFGLCFATEDQGEGMRAFLEKRSPSFSGR